MHDRPVHRALPSASHAASFYRPPGAPRIHFDEAGGGSPPAEPAAPTPPAPAAPGGGPSPGAAPGAPPAAPAASAPYRPEGLPDHLLGKDDKDTVDKLFKAFDGFRRSTADQGTVPEKPDGYTFDASDKLKPYVGNFDKDPIFAKAREIAKEIGMTDKVFRGFVPRILEHFIDGGLVDAPVDPKAMLRELAPAALKEATDAEKEAAGGRIVQDNIAWVDQMKADKTMPEDAASYLAAQAADASGAHALINWLRGAREERRPALNHRAPAGGVTKAELDARVADPRNDPNDVKFDRRFAEETREMFKRAQPG